LSDALSYWQAFVLEHLPGRLLTRDNYRSMKLDAVCRCPFPFGIRPAALEAVAPAWLAPRPPRRRVVGPRRRAGR
jgi:NADH dehydrogenase